MKASIDIGKQLTAGRWIVVLHHHDCQRCKDAIAELRDRIAANDSLVGGNRVALVEVPPYGDATTMPDVLYPRVIRGQLSDAVSWFVATPVEFRLHEGIVESVDAPALR